MSAAAARRRKQLLAKKAAASSGNGEDPITAQLNKLLSPDKVEEAVAYEALQLAQSQLRKSVNRGSSSNSSDASSATVAYGYEICMTLLSKHKKASVASQLLALLAQTLVETHTQCDEAWITRITSLHHAYTAAVKTISTSTNSNAMTSEKNVKEEKVRLMRLQSKFLKKVLGWSDSLGSTRFGALEIHELLGNHCWSLSNDYTDDDDAAANDGSTANKPQEDQEETEFADWSVVGLKCDAVQHLALAENPTQILSYLKTLPPPTAAETKANHPCPPALRDALLTRSILTFSALSNLRDGHVLLSSYISTVEERSIEDLKKSYVDKKDGMAPSHVIFNSILLQLCQKDKKTGPLYTWLLKSFSNQELGKMYKPEVLSAYTTKIGKVYFGIVPPPSMMSTLENMMAMMGGGAGGMGGPGGMGGMNPAMMQAMMQGGGMGGM